MKIKSRKGFTLIELIVVIAILGILALFLVPSFIGYTKDAQKATCDANRHLIERSYTFYKIKNDDKTISDYISGDGIEYQGSQCPSGGIYTYDDVNGKVICSIHNSDDEGNDSENPSDETENQKEKIPGTDLDINNVIPVNSGDSLDYALHRGNIIKLNENGITKYYIVENTIGKGNPINGNYYALNELTDTKAITIEGNDVASIKNTLGNNPQKGTKIYYKNKYYISCSDGYWGSDPEKNEYYWLEIK